MSARQMAINITDDRIYHRSVSLERWKQKWLRDRDYNCRATLSRLRWDSQDESVRQCARMKLILEPCVIAIKV
jgi:hypothetical protein